VTTERLVAVVDDDADLRETIAEILGDAGYRVLGFSGARDALVGLRSLPVLPDLLLLDLMMPGMSGWEFRQEQLQDPKLRDMPVVVLTASTRLDQHPIDANEIVRKPVDILVLLDAIARNAA
jgi:CheY-like chemotaxis protein